MRKVTGETIKKIIDAQFFDSYEVGKRSFDIVMPIKNTNAFFYENLCSIYKSIPVNKLLIGDAGCEDNSLDVLSSFPRVEVFDHRRFETSGVCIADLIRRVETEYFFYLHADIFIPDSKAVEVMLDQIHDAEWLEGFRSHLTIIESTPENYYTDERSYSGMQLGLSSLLKDAVDPIKDGDLQRNEDIVIAELVKGRGGRFKKIKDSIHIHQIMNKDTSHEPAIQNVEVYRNKNDKWEISNMQIQVRGIVMHTNPEPYLIREVHKSIIKLMELGALDDFLVEIKKICNLRPLWKKYLFSGSMFRLYTFMPFYNPRIFFSYLLRKVS